MNSILFGTTNKSKIAEAESILGVKIIGKGLEIDEIQSLDPKEVAIKKARSYFKELKKPLFVEDTSLSFHAFGRLPGTLIDSFLKEIGNNGLIDLLKNQNNRTATAEVHIVYKDAKREKVFVGHVVGTISKTAKGEKGWGWDPILIPDGQSKTFAQMDLSEKNKYSMRHKALEKFKVWLKANKLA